MSRILYIQTPNLSKTPIGAQSGSGLTAEAKQALLACFENVAWKGTDGQDYYNDLETALYSSVNVVSISAVFAQGSAVIYETDSLDTLKQYLTVTAIYDDQTTRAISAYTLSGTLAEGTSTITVSYAGKTDTFDVTVAGAPGELIYNEPLNMGATHSSTWDSSTGTGVIPWATNHYPCLIAQGLKYQYRDIADKTLQISCDVTISEMTGVAFAQILLLSNANPSDNGSVIIARSNFFVHRNENGTFEHTLTKRVSELFQSPDSGGYLGFQFAVDSGSGQMTVSNVVAEVV